MKFLIKGLTLSKIAQFSIIGGLLMIMGVSTYTSNDKLISKNSLPINDSTLTLFKDTLIVTLPEKMIKSKKHLTIVLHLIKK